MLEHVICPDGSLGLVTETFADGSRRVVTWPEMAVRTWPASANLVRDYTQAIPNTDAVRLTGYVRAIHQARSGALQKADRSHLVRSRVRDRNGRMMTVLINPRKLQEKLSRQKRDDPENAGSRWHQRMTPSASEYTAIVQKQDMNALADWVQTRFWSSGGQPSVVEGLVRRSIAPGTPEHMEAEDLVQEMTIHLMENQQRGKLTTVPRSHFAAYATQILANQSRKAARGDRFVRFARTEDIDSFLSNLKAPGQDQEARVIKREEAARSIREYRSLSRKFKQVIDKVEGKHPDRNREIWQRHLQNQGPRQIVSELQKQYPDLTEDAVKSLTKRLRARATMMKTADGRIVLRGVML